MEQDKKARLQFLRENSQKNKLLSALSLISLGVIFFSAVSLDARDRVIEKAGDECESCGKELNGNRVISHIDHTRGDDYDEPSNLLLHCKNCELSHHFKYRKNPNLIGLSKRDNDSSIMTWLTYLAKYSKDDFYAFLLKEKEWKVDEFLKNKQSRKTTLQRFKKQNGLE